MSVYITFVNIHFILSLCAFYHEALHVTIWDVGPLVFPHAPDTSWGDKSQIWAFVWERPARRKQYGGAGGSSWAAAKLFS